MPKFKRLNQRQEIFAQGIASGLSGVEAFKRVTPGNPKDCDAKANQMRGQPGVEERIRELMRENARKSEMNREELLNFYSTVIRTPADQVPAGSPVIQSCEVTESGHKIRICDKIAAGAQLQKMCGWNEPEKLELSSDTLSHYLLELQKQPFFGGPVIDLENGSPAELTNRQKDRG